MFFVSILDGSSWAFALCVGCGPVIYEYCLFDLVIEMFTVLIYWFSSIVAVKKIEQECKRAAP